MRSPSLPPQERRALIEGGMVHRAPLICDECGRPMLAGERVMCADGYERIYGEFVLSVDGLPEDNWPTAHAACAAGTPPAEDD